MRSYASRIMFCCSRAVSSGKNAKIYKKKLCRCVLRTLRVSEVRSRLYRRLRIFRDLHFVDWRASVGSAFTFAVRVFAPGSLLACVRLRVFGSCVRSVWRWSFAWGGSGRVFAPFRGGCSPWVGCLVFVWLWVVVSRFSFCVLLLV